MELKTYANMEGKAAEALRGTALRVDDLIAGEILAIGGLPAGMSSRAPSVTIIAQVDGKPVMLETSLKLFQLAQVVLLNQYGDVTGADWEMHIGESGLEMRQRKGS